MTTVRRLGIVVICSAAVIAAVAAWSNRPGGDDSRRKAQEACEERIAGSATPRLGRVTTAVQRAEALRIAAADPLVRALWGGSTPPVADGSTQPGLFAFSGSPLVDRGPLGDSVIVNLTSSKPLAAGTHRWRIATETFRNDCPADGYASVTLQDFDGDAGGIGIGGPFARTPVILIDVSLSHRRVLSIAPNGAEQQKWRAVGQPERIVPERRDDGTSRPGRSS
jgi:hypothetical protein